MKRCDCNGDLCRVLEDFCNRYVFIKFKCPEYFGTAGRILEVHNNLVVMEYIYGGITVTCCDNICYIIPFNGPNGV